MAFLNQVWTEDQETFTTYSMNVCFKDERKMTTKQLMPLVSADVSDTVKPEGPDTLLRHERTHGRQKVELRRSNKYLHITIRGRVKRRMT